MDDAKYAFAYFIFAFAKKDFAFAKLKYAFAFCVVFLILL